MTVKYDTVVADLALDTRLHRSSFTSCNMIMTSSSRTQRELSAKYRTWLMKKCPRGAMTFPVVQES